MIFSSQYRPMFMKCCFAGKAVSLAQPGSKLKGISEGGKKNNSTCSKHCFPPAFWKLHFLLTKASRRVLPLGCLSPPSAVLRFDCQRQSEARIWWNPKQHGALVEQHWTVPASSGPCLCLSCRSVTVLAPALMGVMDLHCWAHSLEGGEKGNLEEFIRKR